MPIQTTTTSDIWLAGAGAAFTVDLLIYPLDTLKTRLQSPDYARLYTAQGGRVRTAQLYRGLYQGIGSVILATLPSSGAFFSTYEGAKRALAGLDAVPQPLRHAAASGVAELVSCAILTPAEVVKQNAQMVRRTAAGGPNATVQTLRRFRRNPLGLWRGYGALAGRNLPFTALQFPLFERLKERGLRWRERRGVRTGSVAESGAVTAVSAGVAGAIAAVLTTPVDVVKTRIMLAAAEGAAGDAAGGGKSVKDAVGARGESVVDAVGNAVKAGEDAQSNNPFKRKGSVQIAREILAEHGVKGLWRGGALRSVWTMLGSGLYLSVYESGRMYLSRRRGERIKEEDLR